MHNAPSVSYPVGRSRFAGALLLCAWLLGAAACLAWLFSSAATGWRVGAMGVALLLTGVLAAWHWWHMPCGMLGWDQERWTWSGSAGPRDRPEVRLDLQHGLLLYWRAAPASDWLWLERASCPALWTDLRRAVYSRARPDAPPEARPTAAKS